MKIRNKAGKTIFTVKADSLSDAYLRCANIRGAYLRCANIRGADLSGADLSGANLSGADLSRADLRGANIRGANLSGADLSRADLRGANIRGANIRGADLSGAFLSGADLRDAIVHEGYTIEYNTDILLIGPAGSRMDYTHFYKSREGEIIVKCGCFRGTIDEFEEKVRETHGDNQYRKDYRDTIDYVKKVFGRR